jgi:hypothetical protein
VKSEKTDQGLTSLEIGRHVKTGWRSPLLLSLLGGEGRRVAVISRRKLERAERERITETVFFPQGEGRRKEGTRPGGWAVEPGLICPIINKGVGRQLYAPRFLSFPPQ